jgi:hypothetical protein
MNAEKIIEEAVKTFKKLIIGKDRFEVFIEDCRFTGYKQEDGWHITGEISSILPIMRMDWNSKNIPNLTKCRMELVKKFNHNLEKHLKK